jgi:exo-beta-1,3-glucanase (GH17 family)
MIKTHPPYIRIRAVSAAIVGAILMAVVPRSEAANPFSHTVGVGLSTAFQSPATKIPAALAMQQVKHNFPMVRLFDSVSCGLDPELMKEAVANGLEIVLTVPNNCLAQLDSDATAFVATSVVPWKDSIEAIIVGREIFENGGQGYPSIIVNRMQNLAAALSSEQLAIPVTTNINNAIIGPCPPACGFPVNDPSKTHFKPELKDTLKAILEYAQSGPGFITVDIYPWFAIQNAPPPAISLKYATFQGDPAQGCFTTGQSCQNLFQAMYFAWNCSVLELFGKPACTPTTAAVSQPTVVIGETGWASAVGSHQPHPELSSDTIEGNYINGYIQWVKAHNPVIQSFLFEMYDEDLKTPPDSEEQHWGLYCAENNTGKPKFQLDATVVNDSLVQKKRPHDNEGANRTLIVDKRTHAVLGFDLPASVSDPCQPSASTAVLKRATLALTLKKPPRNWGRKGGMVNVHRLNVSFQEGNGNRKQRRKGKIRGNGAGVTWACPGDDDISNGKADCGLRWAGGLLEAAAPTAGALHSRQMAREVRWDVTDDVREAFAVGAAQIHWLIAKKASRKRGRAAYYSKEGAVAAGDMSRAPRLELEFD